MSLPELHDRRVDKAGQELLTSRSVMLLMRLAVGDKLEVNWGSTLKTFKLAYGITEADLAPLEKAGWVARRQARESIVIWITDEGNELVRNLVGWLKLKAEEVVS